MFPFWTSLGCNRECRHYWNGDEEIILFSYIYSQYPGFDKFKEIKKVDTCRLCNTKAVKHISREYIGFIGYSKLSKSDHEHITYLIKKGLTSEIEY